MESVTVKLKVCIHKNWNILENIIKKQKLKLQNISTKYGILEGKWESDSLQKVFLFGKKCYNCWFIFHVDREICLNIKQMFTINVILIMVDHQFRTGSPLSWCFFTRDIKK